LEVIVEPGGIQVPEFRIIQARAILFTSGLHFRGNRFLGHFLGEHAELFDGDPISQKSPDGVSEDLPRAAVQSRDGLLRLNASSSHVYLSRQVGDDDSHVDLEGHLALAATLFDEYLDVMLGRPVRVSCQMYRARPDDDPARTISRQYCRDRWVEGPINRPAEFELHTMKTYCPDGLPEVDSWFRCLSGSIALNSANAGEQVHVRRVVLVEQELTTRESAIEREQIRNFFRLASGELDHILGLYFPPAEGARS
jgi:hypothetical protein